MSEFFTRETWRPGKHRRLVKRIKPYAGRKTAPEAFLASARLMAFKPGRPGYRVCSSLKRDGTPCGRLAMRGLKVCEAHGGFQALARAGKLQPSGRTAAFKALRAAAPEGRSPSASSRLIRLKLYQEADQRMKMKLIRVYGTPAWAVLARQIQDRDRDGDGGM
jgi:hypothetical protein